jgi:hypothetical protein
LIVLEKLHKLQGGPLLLQPERLLVGLLEHVKVLKDLLLQRGNAVREVTIAGMGGIGKSTLAMRVYDDPEVRNHFKGNVCWLRLHRNMQSQEVCSLQEQLLSLATRASFKIYNPEMGRALIRQHLHNLDLLVCLDNVWQTVEGQDKVAVEVDDLSPGSRVLKTARDLGARQQGTEVFSLPQLEAEDAHRLLCWHAFRSIAVPESLEEQVTRAVSAACCGLTLAVKTIGASQHGRVDSESWEALLGNLRRRTGVWGGLQGEKVLETLAISVDSLGRRDWEDCFVLLARLWDAGRESDNLKRGTAVEWLGAAVYDGEQESAEDAVEVLFERCLISVQEGSSYITTHDLLREVAGSIVRKEPLGKFLKSEGYEEEVLSAPEVRHLVMKSGPNDLIPSRQSTSPLQSLVLPDYPFNVLPVFVQQLSSLQLLIVEGAGGFKEEREFGGLEEEGDCGGLKEERELGGLEEERGGTAC